MFPIIDASPGDGNRRRALQRALLRSPSGCRVETRADVDSFCEFVERGSAPKIVGPGVGAESVGPRRGF